MLPTPANFQAVHISAEKRDCLLIARGSPDLGRLQAAPTVQQSADAPALAGADRSITPMCRKETGPGLLRALAAAGTSCAPEPGVQQTPRQRRRQHSCGRRPVQRRFQPPPGRSWNKALIFQRLGGFRSAAGHPDRSTCSSPCVALLGEAAHCRAPGPHTWGERSQTSGGASQIPCPPPERGIQM